MKKYKDFIPRKEAELSLYATGYKHSFRKMAAIAIPLLGEEDIDAHEAEVQEMIDIIQKVESKKAELAGLVSEKNRIVSETIASIRRMATYAKRGKAGSSAEVAGGGITCRAVHLDVKDLQPKLTLTSHGTHVEVAFNKHNILSIELYTRNRGELDWTFLGYVPVSPYLDKRPLAQTDVPEIREYRACYTDYRQCISQMSSIVSVVFSGGVPLG